MRTEDKRNRLSRFFINANTCHTSLMFFGGKNILVTFVPKEAATLQNINNMQYHISAPTKIDTTIALPASKSISNRAMIIHALSGGGTLPDNLSDCDDTEVIRHALEHSPQTVDIKAAGTAMRFLTAYFAATPCEHTITGTERMKQRPIGPLVDALRFLGADIEYLEEEGFPPLHIRGRQLDGGHVEIPGNVSSQYISALLMIGPALKNGLELKMTGEIVSRPYIELTLWMMREFGAEADWSEADTVCVRPKPYTRRAYTIESDWSSASYWYEMLALCGDSESSIRLTGLYDGSKQGDSVVKYIFSLLGIKTVFESKEEGCPTTVTLRKTPCMLPRLDYDFISSPDLAQTVVVTCVMLDIPFRFTGLASLRIKETDRIEALKAELRKFGIALTDENRDTLCWEGERCEPSAPVFETYEDHRMAMSLAPACLMAGDIYINNPEVVSKSYPRYWDDLRKAGFIINERP